MNKIVSILLLGLLMSSAYAADETNDIVLKPGETIQAIVLDSSTGTYSNLKNISRSAGGISDYIYMTNGDLFLAAKKGLANCILETNDAYVGTSPHDAYGILHFRGQYKVNGVVKYSYDEDGSQPMSARDIVAKKIRTDLKAGVCF